MRAEQKWLASLLAVLAAGVVLSGWMWPDGRVASGWLVTLCLVTAFVLTAGKYCSGLWRGALLDNRKMLSLSRFQLAIWTVLVLTGIFSAAFNNLAHGKAVDALDIAISPQLLALLGISATSFIGSPLLKGQKMKGAQSQLLQANQARVEAKGALVANRDAKDAGWGDLLMAEEAQAYGTLDLGKVQMLLITLVLALVYGFALGECFSTARGSIRELPELSGGMNMLLGISHSAYLLNKALPR